MAVYKWFGQSPSSIGTFLTCPRQYKAKYLTKEVVFKPNEKTLYGDRMHKDMEGHLLRGTELTPEFAHLKPVADAIKSWKGKLFVELTLAVDNYYQPVEWRQRTVGCKVDILHVAADKPGHARIIDWKTGKPREDTLQLDINAITVFRSNPGINTIRAGFAYTANATISKYDYTREELELHEGRLTGRLSRMMNAFDKDDFKPQPSGLCHGWCDVKSCEFNKSRS